MKVSKHGVNTRGNDRGDAGRVRWGGRQPWRCSGFAACREAARAVRAGRPAAGQGAGGQAAGATKVSRGDQGPGQPVLPGHAEGHQGHSGAAASRPTVHGSHLGHRHHRQAKADRGPGRGQDLQPTRVVCGAKAAKTQPAREGAVQPSELPRVDEGSASLRRGHGRKFRPQIFFLRTRSSW